MINTKSIKKIKVIALIFFIVLVVVSFAIYGYFKIQQKIKQTETEAYSRGVYDAFYNVCRENNNDHEACRTQATIKMINFTTCFSKECN